MTRLQEIGRDQGLHVELAIHWSPTNVQWVVALVDIGIVCIPLYGNPEKFLGPEACLDGYGGQSIQMMAVQLSLDIRCLSSHPVSIPLMYPLFMSISWVLMRSRDCGYNPLQESFMCGCEW